MKQKRECRRCGTCCKKGGPALHEEDKVLIDNGTISLHNLVTVRRGEPAFHPRRHEAEPVGHEFVKVGGKKGSWECIFYDAAHSACVIHQNRPLECRLLECWDTAAIEKITGKNCLERFDILPDNSPIKDIIVLHEEVCSAWRACTLLNELPAGMPQQEIQEQLSGMMRQDLEIRDSAVARFRLSLQEELFYFGRPLFQVLHHARLHVHFHGGTLHLEIIPPRS